MIISIVGMCIFNIGLTYGLGAIGSQTGGVLPAAFMHLPVSEILQFIQRWWEQALSFYLLFYLDLVPLLLNLLKRFGINRSNPY